MCKVGILACHLARCCRAPKFAYELWKSIKIDCNHGKPELALADWLRISHCRSNSFLDDTRFALCLFLLYLECLTQHFPIERNNSDQEHPLKHLACLWPTLFSRTPTGSPRYISESVYVFLPLRWEPWVGDANRCTKICQPCASSGHLICPVTLGSKIAWCQIALLNLVREFAYVSNQRSICLEMCSISCLL